MTDPPEKPPARVTPDTAPGEKLESDSAATEDAPLTSVDAGEALDDDFAIDIDFDDDELFDPGEAAPLGDEAGEEGQVSATNEVEVRSELDGYEAIEIAPPSVVVHGLGGPAGDERPPPPVQGPADGADRPTAGPGLDAAFDETLPPILDAPDAPVFGGSAAPEEPKKKLTIPGVELLGVGETGEHGTLPPGGLPEMRGSQEEPRVPYAYVPDLEDTQQDTPALRVETMRTAGSGDHPSSPSAPTRAGETPPESDATPLPWLPTAEPAESGEDELAVFDEDPSRSPSHTAPYRKVGAAGSVLGGEAQFDPTLLAPPTVPPEDRTSETQRSIRPLAFGEPAQESRETDAPDVTLLGRPTDALPRRPHAEAPGAEVPGAEVPEILEAPTEIDAESDLPFEPESISGLPLPAPTGATGDSGEVELPDPNTQTNVGFQVLAGDEPEATLTPLPPLPSFDVGFPPIKADVGREAAKASLQAGALAQSDRGGEVEDAFDFDVEEPGTSLTDELEAAMSLAVLDTIDDAPAQRLTGAEPVVEAAPPAAPLAQPKQSPLFEQSPPEPLRPGPPTEPPKLLPPSLPGIPQAPMDTAPPVDESEPVATIAMAALPQLPETTHRALIRAPAPPTAAVPPPLPARDEPSPRSRVTYAKSQEDVELVSESAPESAEVTLPAGQRELPPEASEIEDYEPLADVRFDLDQATPAPVSRAAQPEVVALPESPRGLIEDLVHSNMFIALAEPVSGLDSDDLPGIPQNPFERDFTPVMSGGALPEEFHSKGLPELEPLEPLSEQREAVEALSGEHVAAGPAGLDPAATGLTAEIREYLAGLLEVRPGPGGIGFPEDRAANVEVGTLQDVVLTARLSEYGRREGDALRVVTPSAPLARAIVDGLVRWPERPTVLLGRTGSGKSHTLNRFAGALASRLLGLGEADGALEDELEPLLEEGDLPLPIVVDATTIATLALSDGEAMLRELVDARLLPAELLDWRGAALVLVDNVDVALALGLHGLDPLYLLRTLLNTRPAWRAVVATRPLADAVFMNWGSLHGPFPVVELAGLRAPQTRAMLLAWSEVAQPRPQDPAALTRLLPGEVSASPRLVQMLLGQWLTAATEIEAATMLGGGSSIARLVLDGVCKQTEVRTGTRNTRQDLQILADTLGGLGTAHLLLEDVQALLEDGYLRDDLDTLQSTGVVEVQMARGDQLVGGLTFTHPLFREVLLAEYLEQEVLQLALRKELNSLVAELQPATELAPYAISQVRRLIEVADLLVDELASHLRGELTEALGTWLWHQLNAEVFPDNLHYPRLVSVAWIIASRNNATDGAHDAAIEQLKTQCAPALIEVLKEAGEEALANAIEAL